MISGGFTIHHALAIFTYGTTTLGVLSVRRGHAPGRTGNMVGSWVGAVVAGVFCGPHARSNLSDAGYRRPDAALGVGRMSNPRGNRLGLVRPVRTGKRSRGGGLA